VGRPTWPSPAASGAADAARRHTWSATTTAWWSSRRRWPRRCSPTAVEQEAQERFVTDQVSTRASIDGLYPLAGAWLDRPTGGWVAEGQDEETGRAVTDSLSKSQRGYEVIKSRIVDGSYSPGFRLVLDQLAGSCRVSPSADRGEAVRPARGPSSFVQFERNVGARVTGINPTEYAAHHADPGIVEGAATGLAAPLLSPAELARANEVNEGLRACLRETSTRWRSPSLNREFTGC